MDSFWAIPSILLVIATALLLLVTVDGRLRLAQLALQYVGVFILVSLSWPFELAVVKLVAGWMAATMLGMAVVGQPQTESPAPDLGSLGERLPGPFSAPFRPDALPRQALRFLPPLQRILHLLAGLLVGLTALSIAPQVVEWAPGLQFAQAWGGLLLMGMGLLQLGFTGQPLSTILGLLTVLSGFEIMYAALEASALVAGLLAAIHLGLGLAGSYLLLAPSMEATE